MVAPQSSVFATGGKVARYVLCHPLSWRRCRRTLKLCTLTEHLYCIPNEAVIAEEE